MMTPDAKPLAWIGTSREDLRAFPDEARVRAGRELRRVQIGLLPEHWKPMPSIGPGVSEIRIRMQTAHRVIYVTRFAEAIYVLHAFEKRSQKTSRGDIQIARKRLAALILDRVKQRPSA